MEKSISAFSFLQVEHNNMTITNPLKIQQAIQLTDASSQDSWESFVVRPSLFLDKLTSRIMSLDNYVFKIIIKLYHLQVLTNIIVATLVIKAFWQVGIHPSASSLSWSLGQSLVRINWISRG